MSDKKRVQKQSTSPVQTILVLLLFAGGIYWAVAHFVKPDLSNPSTPTPPVASSPGTVQATPAIYKYDNMNVRELALEIDTNFMPGQGSKQEALWSMTYEHILQGESTIGGKILKNLLDTTKGECQVAVKALYVKLGGHLMTSEEIESRKQTAAAQDAEDAKCISLRIAKPLNLREYPSATELDKERNRRISFSSTVDEHTIVVDYNGKSFMISGVAARKYSVGDEIYWEAEDQAMFDIGKRTHPSSVMIGDNRLFDVYTPKKSK